MGLRLKILELESPVDKEDIVRFKDDYGREGEDFQSASELRDLNDSNVIFKELI